MLPGGGTRFGEAAAAMQSLGTDSEQPGLLHSACLTDTKSSYSNRKIILIGLS